MTKQKGFLKREAEGAKRIGGFGVQCLKELSTIPAYAAREVTGSKNTKHTPAKLKKGWFE